MVIELINKVLLGIAYVAGYTVGFVQCLIRYIGERIEDTMQ